MKIRDLWPAMLWSRGNEAAFFLIALVAGMSAFGGQLGIFRRDADSLWQSKSFWVCVSALLMFGAVDLGRRVHTRTSQWLGDGERIEVAPERVNHLTAHVTWNEVFPRRPLRSTEEDAGYQVLIAGFAAFIVGLIASYLSDPPGQSANIGAGMIFGVVCALAGMTYAWFGYGPKDKSLVPSKAYREAYLTAAANGNGLDFVVVSRENTTSRGGVVLVRMPWTAVNIFDSGSYWRSFGLSVQSTHEDWNVIKMTPTVGEPVMITETYAAEARLYDLVTSLTEKFGPAARARYEKERHRNTQAAQSHDRGAQSPGSDVPSRFE